MKNILITGGCGFIGAHVIRRFVQRYPDYTIVNLDSLTYAGNPENIGDAEQHINYHFEKADLRNLEEVLRIFSGYRITDVIHLAAESHVDRSIHHPLDFVESNVIGTVNLLEGARKFWGREADNHRFHHVSTDEVYGSLGEAGLFTEHTRYDPHSPYSASKAASDHFVRAYGTTYNLDFTISNCSNNFGPGQHSEKLIPMLLEKIMDRKPIPVYGNGTNIRDWLFVTHHAEAIDLIFHSGSNGETYNVGANNEWTNIDLIRFLCQKMDQRLGRANGSSERLISFVPDRAGHDQRYAIDSSKIREKLGWYPSGCFELAVDETIDWYLNQRGKRLKPGGRDEKLVKLLRSMTKNTSGR